VNRAYRADFVGDVDLTSWRPDKDSDGSGVSIVLAVVGVVAAGLGLVTMHTAFKPLPKAGVPVVISHAPAPLAEAAWRHARAARPQIQDADTRDVDAVAGPEPEARHDDVRPQAAPPPAADSSPAAKPAPASTLSPLPGKLSVQEIAKADVPGEKLCKAPAPQVLSAKALQPAMILRYDSKFKAPPLDIEPQRPPSEDEQRQIKLSKVLANILDN